jgi:hypothetical protein
MEQSVVASDVERSDMAIVVSNSAGQLHQAQKAIAANEERIPKDKDQMGTTHERSVTQQASNAADLLLQRLAGCLLAPQVKRTQLLTKFDPR